MSKVTAVFHIHRKLVRLNGNKEKQKEIMIKTITNQILVDIMVS